MYTMRSANTRCWHNSAGNRVRYGCLRRVSVQAAQNGAASPLVPMDDLPAEKGLPVIGNAHKIGKGLFPPLFAKHGSPFMVNMGPLGGWNLALNTEDEVSECLKRNDCFGLAWPDSTARLAFPAETNLPDDKALVWRQALLSVMTPDVVLSFQLPLMGPDFLKRLHALANSGDTVLWRLEARRMAYSVASRAAIGEILTEEDLEMLFELFGEFSQGTLAINYGLKDGLPGTTYHKAVAAKKKIQAFLQPRIEAAIADRERLNASDSVIKRLLAGLEEQGLDFDKVSNREIAIKLSKEAVFLMFVGTDNSAYMLAQCVALLYKNPRWLEEMYVEQARLQEEFGEELNRKVISRSNVAMAVAQEALRVKPPAKVLFRVALKDTHIAGVSVPKGTKVCLYVAEAIQKTGANRGFDPMNWLSEDLSEGKLNKARGNYVWGAGPRRCVGQQLATVELVAALCALAREVKSIDMSQEEADRDFPPYAYPTPMPLLFEPRRPDKSSAAAGASTGELVEA